MSPKLDLLQGTLDLMVLKTLAAMGSLHGYGIARRIEQVSGNQVLLNQGTIYASLVRLEQRGWIASALGSLRQQPQSQVLLHHQAGRRQLAAEAHYWERLTGVMDRVLRHEQGRRRGARMSEPSAFYRPPVAPSFSGVTLDADLDAELAAHIDFAIDEDIRARPAPRRSPPSGAHPLRRHATSTENITGRHADL